MWDILFSEYHDISFNKTLLRMMLFMPLSASQRGTPCSTNTKIDLLNTALFATAEAHTHHCSETSLVVVLSQLTWLSSCGLDKQLKVFTLSRDSN